MTTTGIVTAWAVGWLVVIAAVVAAARRIGPGRAGVWLVVLGLALLTIESFGESFALTLWLAVTGPRGDPDGMATLLLMARAHVLEAAVVGVAGALLLGWIAMTAMRRGEPWAHRVLRGGFAVAAVTYAATTVFVFSRGLALPGRGGGAGNGGLGWQPIAVGLAAWALGLWLARPPRVDTGRRSAAAVEAVPCP